MADDIDSLISGTRARIIQLLEDRGQTIVDLVEKTGISEGGFHSRFREGSVKLSTLGEFAKALDMPVGELLPDDQRATTANIVSEPQAEYRPRSRYLEERVAWLEAEVRKLKEQKRPR